MDRVDIESSVHGQSADAPRTKPIPEKVWTIKDLAGRPYSRTHLSQLVNTGKLKAKRDGKYCLILDTDWRAYLASLPDAARATQ